MSICSISYLAISISLRRMADIFECLLITALILRNIQSASGLIKNRADIAPQVPVTHLARKSHYCTCSCGVCCHYFTDNNKWSISETVY